MFFLGEGVPLKISVWRLAFDGDQVAHGDVEAHIPQGEASAQTIRITFTCRCGVVRSLPAVTACGVSAGEL